MTDGLSGRDLEEEVAALRRELADTRHELARTKQRVTALEEENERQQRAVRRAIDRDLRGEEFGR